MAPTLQLRETLSSTDQKAFMEAKALVQWAEAKHGGDPNKVAAEIMKAKPEVPNKVGFLTNDVLYKTRVAEIAEQYAKVSDGKGGIDPSSSRHSVGKLQNVLEGKMASGDGYSLSNRLAIMAEKESHLSTGVLKNISEMGGMEKVKKMGLPGKVIGGLVATVTAGSALAAEEEKAGKPLTATEKAGVVGNAVGDAMIPGYKDARQGNMCKAFGDVVGTVAEGGTYAAGIAGGTTVGVATSWSGVGIAAGAGIVAMTPAAAESAGNLGRAGGESLCNGAGHVARAASDKYDAFKQNAGDMLDRVTDTSVGIIASVKQTFGFGR